jgi:hypothetical protein
MPLGSSHSLHLLFKRSAEGSEIRFEKPNVSTHYAEMGNLLSLNPKIHSLGADAKIGGSFPNHSEGNLRRELVSFGLVGEESLESSRLPLVPGGFDRAGYDATICTAPCKEIFGSPEYSCGKGCGTSWKSLYISSRQPWRARERAGSTLGMVRSRLSQEMRGEEGC